MGVVLSALPFFWFLLISGLTTGPNNLMLMASGIRFGYYRTLRHIAGIVTGFLLLTLIAALGVGEVYQAYPLAQLTLKVLGSAYLLYLAWRIFSSAGLSHDQMHQQREHPIGFIESAGFQFINPKGILFAVSAINLLPTDVTQAERLLMTVLAVIPVALISTHTWTLFGTLIAKLFTDDRSRRLINTFLALLLVLIVPVMFL